jgi:glutamate-1-semialdehyde 2,1-aminomutase
VVDRFAPSGVELVRFTNSGTEANTMAIAAALASTGRKKILVFHNGYHGGTLYFPKALPQINTNLPHDFVFAPYNDIEGTKDVISKLPQDSLAAILVEPIQGSGGCIVGDKKFLEYLDTTAHELEAVFIVDEVMTSRLAYSGLSSSLGLQPDIITLGKWIGGGMSFGAFGGQRDGSMFLFDPRESVLAHSGTFNNNIVTMAAGCAGLDLYTEDEVQRLNDLGDVLKSGIESILAKHKVRGPKIHKSDVPETPSVEPSPPIITPHGFDFASLTLSEEAGMWVSGRWREGFEGVVMASFVGQQDLYCDARLHGLES